MSSPRLKQIKGATTGSILFINANGIVAEDNSNLFWDDSSNLLGIGTVSPTAKLHVINTANDGSTRLLIEGRTTGSGNNNTIAHLKHNLDNTSTDKLLVIEHTSPAGGSPNINNRLLEVLGGYSTFTTHQKTGLAISSHPYVGIGIAPEYRVQLRIDQIDGDATIPGTGTKTVYATNTTSRSVSGLTTKYGVHIASTGTWNDPTSQSAVNYALYITATGGDTDYSIYSTAGDIHLDAGSFVFNESGGDYDFRIEGDTETNLFFADASTDRIGIGVSTPSDLLHVVGNIRAQSGQIYGTENTPTIGGTPESVDFDWNNGNSQTIDLQTATSDVAVTLTNGKAGTIYTIRVVQGSPARNLTWPAEVKWGTAGAPTITVTDNATDIITFYCDGTNYYGRYDQAY